MGQRQWQLQWQLQWQWQWGRGALGHWGRSNRSNGNGGMGATTIDRIAIVSLYVVWLRKTSTIVVGESMQNVWTANIRNVCC
jgi:hypothetical protein